MFAYVCFYLHVPGNVQENSTKFPGNGQEMSGNLAENVLEMSDHPRKNTEIKPI